MLQPIWVSVVYELHHLHRVLSQGIGSQFRTPILAIASTVMHKRKRDNGTANDNEMEY